MSSSLIGKTIKQMKIAEDKTAILFITDEGEFIARVDADCCSHTWVETIESPALGFPALVMSIDDLDMQKDGEDDEDGEYIQFYGSKVSTNKGDMVIDYRNSSNGYYGGDIVWPDDNQDGRFYGGVYGQNISNEKWIDIDFE
tara:strand:- start:2432 stop:2857 length:426 start_codon:yes stop_codon:yes gene_type:complete